MGKVCSSDPWTMMEGFALFQRSTSERFPPFSIRVPHSRIGISFIHRAACARSRALVRHGDRDLQRDLHLAHPVSRD